MFSPNLPCLVYLSSGTSDIHGQPTPSTTSIAERCAVVKLATVNQKTSIRADSSGSRGNAREIIVDAVILLTPTTKANIDDIIKVNSVGIRITTKQPQFDIQGNIDHYRVEGMIWRTV
jgi:hypothetical protein